MLLIEHSLIPCVYSLQQMKSAKELEEQLRAEERLRARGWRFVACQTCKGTERELGTPYNCVPCAGMGGEWKAPTAC